MSAPLFRRPAPALYFHPFLVFQMPPFEGGNQNSLPFNKRVKTMLIDLRKSNNSCILTTCLKRRSYIATGKIILK